MTHSETINDLAVALAKAQAAIKGAVKDSTNPHFKSDYADLASVWDACRSALTGNGLSVIQTGYTTDDGRVGVTTMLLHASGQWMRGDLAMKPTKDDPQGVGSCLTYARRYALAAMVGVAPADDDGNAASKPQPVVKPVGYDDWMLDFALTADEGYRAIANAFKASKREYRDFLTAHDGATYTALKAKAQQVGK